MLLKNNNIYCFNCNKWYDAYTQIFLHVLYEGSISCPNDHLVGNDFDKEWTDLMG